MKIKEKVLRQLAIDIDSRNSDFELVFKYWEMYLGVELPIDVKDKIKSGPSIHSLFRFRAEIQNKDKKYLPNDDVMYERERNYLETTFERSELSKDEKLAKFRDIRNLLK